MARSMRAQLSLEFIVLIAMLLFVLSLVVVTYYGKKGEALIAQADISAKLEVQKFANEVNVALLAGDGYSRRVSLPLHLYTGSYVSFRLYPAGRAVWANYSFSGRRELSAPILGPVLNATLGNGTMDLGGDVLIVNLNGTAVVSNG